MTMSEWFFLSHEFNISWHTLTFH